MPDCGVFPLWLDSGGMVARQAREELGLDEELVDRLSAWGQEADFAVVPPGWEERGRQLRRELVDALGDRFEVEYLPD